MFHYLYYFVTINESKVKFGIVFCCFSVIKKLFAPSSFSNFPTKFICWGILVFVCLDKSIYTNIFDDANNLIIFLLYNYHFLTFQQAIHTLHVFFVFLVDQKMVCEQLIH